MRSHEDESAVRSRRRVHSARDRAELSSALRSSLSAPRACSPRRIALKEKHGIDNWEVRRQYSQITRDPGCVAEEGLRRRLLQDFPDIEEQSLPEKMVSFRMHRSLCAL